jgi:hypothetical protein
MNTITFNNLKRAYFSTSSFVNCFFSFKKNNSSYNIIRQINPEEPFVNNYIKILTFCIRHRYSKRTVSGILTNISGVRKVRELILSNKL